jgi:hypothetical protein
VVKAVEFQFVDAVEAQCDECLVTEDEEAARVDFGSHLPDVDVGFQRYTDGIAAPVQADAMYLGVVEGRPLAENARQSFAVQDAGGHSSHSRSERNLVRARPSAQVEIETLVPAISGTVMPLSCDIKTEGLCPAVKRSLKVLCQQLRS